MAVAKSASVLGVASKENMLVRAISISESGCDSCVAESATAAFWRA